LTSQQRSLAITTVAKKPNWFSRLAHPGAFMGWSRHLVWPLAGAAALCFVLGLWLGFFNAPLETENVGTTLPILYIHVPNAWLSQFVYGVMVVASLGTLVWRHPLADVAAK
jgi:heme exporter protein C